MGRVRTIMMLVTGAAAIVLVLYVFSINSTKPISMIPNAPRLSTAEVIRIIQDDLNREVKIYTNDNNATAKITDIAINRTTIAQEKVGYVSSDRFSKENMKLPLDYIHPNRTVFLLSENGYSRMGECYTGLSTYCGYLHPYDLNYKGRLLYGAEFLVAEEDSKGSYLYAVDAMSGEVVDSSFLRNEHYTKYPDQGSGG